jgi:hypothetical protein
MFFSLVIKFSNGNLYNKQDGHPNYNSANDENSTFVL